MGIRVVGSLMTAVMRLIFFRPLGDTARRIPNDGPSWQIGDPWGSARGLHWQIRACRKAFPRNAQSTSPFRGFCVASEHREPYAPLIDRRAGQRLAELPQSPRGNGIGCTRAYSVHFRAVVIRKRAGDLAVGAIDAAHPVKLRTCRTPHACG